MATSKSSNKGMNPQWVNFFCPWYIIQKIGKNHLELHEVNIKSVHCCITCVLYDTSRASNPIRDILGNSITYTRPMRIKCADKKKKWNIQEQEIMYGSMAYMTKIGKQIYRHAVMYCISRDHGQFSTGDGRNDVSISIQSELKLNRLYFFPPILTFILSLSLSLSLLCFTRKDFTVNVKNLTYTSACIIDERSNSSSNQMGNKVYKSRLTDFHLGNSERRA